MAIVFKFIKRLRSSKPHPTQPSAIKHPSAVFLSDEEINSSKTYFFRNTSEEMKHFHKSTFYKNISTEQDCILIYTGRILPSENVTVVSKMTSVMKDLCSTSFYVPSIDKHSPIAYSIINEIHWYSEVKHQGVETVWRYVLKTAFIIKGRELVKIIPVNAVSIYSRERSASQWDRFHHTT